MSNDLSFRELIGRVRAGDERAASELVRRYEPAIRRAVRFRLTELAPAPDLRLHGRLPVGADELLRPRPPRGQYDLDTPNQLLRLLTTMARKQAAQPGPASTHARLSRQTAWSARTSPSMIWRPQPPGPPAAGGGGGAPPPRDAAGKYTARLSPEELRLVELRKPGPRTGASIAAQVGGSPVALRQKAASRPWPASAGSFGLEEGDDE